jgi:hypothetical protein
MISGFIHPEFDFIELEVVQQKTGFSERFVRKATRRSGNEHLAHSLAPKLIQSNLRKPLPHNSLWHSHLNGGLGRVVPEWQFIPIVAILQG